MPLDVQEPLDDLPLLSVERVDNITREEFLERFVKTNTPVVIRGLAEREGWAAWAKWTPDYFKQRFGDRQVMVACNGVGSGDVRDRTFYGGLVEMNMREYLDKILESGEDMRLAARHTVDIARELADDYGYPALGKNWATRVLWLFFGSRGSHTKLHYDLGRFHVLHTCFLGRKTFCLFPNDQGRALHSPWLTVRSPVNPNKPDFEKYPRLRKVKGWRVDIDRGDTLYLPKGAWHDVMYHDPSIALTQRFIEDDKLVGVRVVCQLLVNRLAESISKRFPGAWARFEELVS
jgi:hypothetical protein